MTLQLMGWRMVAFDSNEDPIYGPWETREEAEQRRMDAVDGRFIRSGKIERLK